jgi:SAM-dependent methyltransferase
MSSAGRVSESERASPERFDPATMNGLIAAEHLARYWLATDLASGLDVLDAGCGVGYGAEMIARAGASRVVGIDLAPEAIATASERAGELVDFQVGDVQDPPFDEGAFDLVVCFEVLEHLEDPEPVITALKGVLREGGLLLVSSPNRGVYPPGNPHHLHEFTLEELRDALTARFANVVLMRQHPWLASLVDNGTLTSPGEEPVRASVATAGKAVDEWTYVVALASDGPIDEPGAISVLAEAVELRDLQEAVGAAETSRQKLRTALDAAHESKQRKLREALTAANERQRKLRQALATANEDRASLRAALEAAAAKQARLWRELHETERWLRGLEGSRSWRITRPLRAAGAAFRRLSQWRTAPRRRRV